MRLVSQSVTWAHPDMHSSPPCPITSRRTSDIPPPSACAPATTFSEAMSALYLPLFTLALVAGCGLAAVGSDRDSLASVLVLACGLPLVLLSGLFTVVGLAFPRLFQSVALPDSASGKAKASSAAEASSSEEDESADKDTKSDAKSKDAKDKPSEAKADEKVRWKKIEQIWVRLRPSRCVV